MAVLDVRGYLAAGYRTPEDDPLGEHLQHIYGHGKRVDLPKNQVLCRKDCASLDDKPVNADVDGGVFGGCEIGAPEELKRVDSLEFKSRVRL